MISSEIKNTITQDRNDISLIRLKKHLAASAFYFSIENAQTLGLDLIIPYWKTIIFQPFQNLLNL